MVRVRVLRIQLESASELGFRSDPIPPMAHGKAQRGVGFSRVWINVERFACRCVSFRERLGWGLKPMPRHSAVAVGHPRIFRGISRIRINRLLKILLRLFHTR